MAQQPDEGGTSVSNDPEKRDWDTPRVARLFAGDAEGNPGDTHPDGPTTFS